MIDYLHKMSNFYLFIFLSSFFIAVSLISIVVIKRFFAINLRYRDNPVLGNIGSIIGIIYGVLSGLTALYLINNISYANDAVQREANTVANIYRDSNWLKEPARARIQTEVKNYVLKVIHVDWPLMQEGKDIDNKGDSIINKMSNVLKNYPVVGNSDLLIVRDMLEEIKSLYDARQQRMQMSFSALNSEMWIVILLGSILTLAVNYLFKMNFYLHLLTVTAAALMASSMIFLLVTLDRPFQGEFVVEPRAFQSLLASME